MLHAIAAPHRRQHEVFFRLAIARNDRPDRTPDHFPRRIAEHALGRPVPRPHDPFEIFRNDRIVGRLDDCRELARVPQLVRQLFQKVALDALFVVALTLKRRQDAIVPAADPRHRAAQRKVDRESADVLPVHDLPRDAQERGILHEELEVDGDETKDRSDEGLDWTASRCDRDHKDEQQALQREGTVNETKTDGAGDS